MGLGITTHSEGRVASIHQWKLCSQRCMVLRGKGKQPRKNIERPLGSGLDPRRKVTIGGANYRYRSCVGDIRCCHSPVNRKHVVNIGTLSTKNKHPFKIVLKPNTAGARQHIRGLTCTTVLSTHISYMPWIHTTKSNLIQAHRHEPQINETRDTPGGHRLNTTKRCTNDNVRQINKIYQRPTGT